MAGVAADEDARTGGELPQFERLRSFAVDGTVAHAGEDVTLICAPCMQAFMEER